jgi:hypothetical protein
MDVIDFNPPLDRYDVPVWNKKRPVVPYQTLSTGNLEFLTYAAYYSSMSWAEVEQDFVAQMVVMKATTGRSAANIELLEPKTKYRFTSTQTDLNWLLQNMTLNKGLISQTLTWRWNKRGANYLLNIVERLDSVNS